MEQLKQINMSIKEELGKHEKILQVTEPHQLSFIGQYFSVALIGLFFFIFSALFGVVIMLLGILLVELVRQNNKYYVTNKRVIHDFTFYFLMRKMSNAFYDKLQDLHLTQGLIDRLFDLGTLSFNTAGSHVIEIKFKGIKNPTFTKKLIEEHLRKS